MVLGAEGSLYSEIPDGVLARWDADHRSGKRSRAGLAQRLLESLESVEVRSASGLYLGAGKRFTLDVPRVNRVLTKIVKGLFFHELGRRLPGDARVYVEIKPDVAVLEREPFGWVRSEQASTPRRLGGVLTYRYFAFPDCVEASLWLLAFYAAFSPWLRPRRPSSATSPWRADGGSVWKELLLLPGRRLGGRGGLGCHKLSEVRRGLLCGAIQPPLLERQREVVWSVRLGHLNPNQAAQGLFGEEDVGAPIVLVLSGGYRSPMGDVVT